MKILCNNANLVFAKAKEFVNLIDPTTVVNGFLSTSGGFGGGTSFNGYIRSGYVPVSEDGIVATPASGSSANVFSTSFPVACVYDSNKTFIRAIMASSNAETLEPTKYTYQIGDAYVVFSFKTAETSLEAASVKICAVEGEQYKYVPYK